MTGLVGITKMVSKSRASAGAVHGNFCNAIASLVIGNGQTGGTTRSFCCPAGGRVGSCLCRVGAQGPGYSVHLLNVIGVR